MFYQNETETYCLCYSIYQTTLFIGEIWNLTWVWLISRFWSNLHLSSHVRSIWTMNSAKGQKCYGKLVSRNTDKTMEETKQKNRIFCGWMSHRSQHECFTGSQDLQDRPRLSLAEERCVKCHAGLSKIHCIGIHTWKTIYQG